MAPLTRGSGQARGCGLKWYRRAAEQGHAAAQFNLGALYVEGRGVKRDDSAALYWLRRAAGRDEAEAPVVPPDR